jgi:hypothetical protein
MHWLGDLLKEKRKHVDDFMSFFKMCFGQDLIVGIGEIYILWVQWIMQLVKLRKEFEVWAGKYMFSCLWCLMSISVKRGEKCG